MDEYGQISIKRIVTGLLVTLFCVLCLRVGSSAADERTDPAKVLVVADSPAVGNELLSLLSANGQSAQLVLRSVYKAGMVQGYSHLVTNCVEPLEEARAAKIKMLLVGSAVEEDERVPLQLGEKQNAGIEIKTESYRGDISFTEKITYIVSHTGGEPFGSVKIQDEEYPFAVLDGLETYVPYYRMDDLSAILLSELIRMMLGDPSEGRMYIVIDEVYAFSDLYSLCFAADLLYENAMPFIVRIMPIYDNLDYPAFLRFAQVLRYLQAKNGTIVPAPPLVSNEPYSWEPLEEKLNRFYDALDRENIRYFSMAHTPYPVDVPFLKAIHSAGKNFGRLPVDTMIRLTLYDDEEAMREEVDELNDLWLSVDNYRRNFTQANYQYHEVSIDEQYAYILEEEKLFEKQIEVGNNVLVMVVGLLLLIFLGLLVIGSRIYKRKFH